ncbi:hypothetical protein ACHHYP_06475 [Achlya hypogyna]|uniref:Ricin B lectin domain-containing protein n=1 Tax=Achlya hypogyna TaxID=1202772 RepID=A0A1V9YTJ9_ACHHY|nr:hypothetical protein ACHHYP_06475 [Achlya hypogyna]
MAPAPAPTPAPVILGDNVEIYISSSTGGFLSGWSYLVDELNYTSYSIADSKGAYSITQVAGGGITLKGWDAYYLTKCETCAPTTNGSFVGLVPTLSPTASVWTYASVDSTHITLKDSDGLCLTVCPGCLPDIGAPHGDLVLTAPCVNLPTQVWTVAYA